MPYQFRDFALGLQCFHLVLRQAEKGFSEQHTDNLKRRSI